MAMPRCLVVFLLGAMFATAARGGSIQRSREFELPQWHAGDLTTAARRIGETAFASERQLSVLAVVNERLEDGSSVERETDDDLSILDPVVTVGGDSRTRVRLHWFRVIKQPGKKQPLNHSLATLHFDRASLRSNHLEVTALADSAEVVNALLDAAERALNLKPILEEKTPASTIARTIDRNLGAVPVKSSGQAEAVEVERVRGFWTITNSIIVGLFSLAAACVGYLAVSHKKSN